MTDTRTEARRANIQRLREALRFDPTRTAEYVARGYWRDETLNGLLARHVAERPGAIAIVQGSTVLTYQELAERVARFAGGLRALGVMPGEVVAVQLPNLIELLVAHFAITRIGAVIATIHMPYRAAELATLLAHSRAVAAIVLTEAKDWSPAQAVLDMRARLPALEHVISVGADGAHVSGALDFGRLSRESPPLDPTTPAPRADDPFLLLYTSGTTSAPKGVPHDYRTLLSNARLGAPEHRLTAADRIVSAAPLSHLYGLYSLHVAWSVGAATVLLPVFTPPDLAVVIERDQPTALWTGPAHVAAWRAGGFLDKHDFGSLRLAIVSGSAAPPELVRWFQEKLPRCAVTQLWGMTETQAALYSRPGDPPDVPQHTAGRPSPGTEIRIVDADDRPVAADIEGELQVRGPLLFARFLDNDAANAAAFTADGWYRTGDLAKMNPAGCVAITGRSKEIINRGGIKFNPRDIEDLLEQHPKVQQSAIVPMPDPVLGERSCCFITLRPGVTTVSLDELVGYLSEHRIAKIKLPERLVIVPEMPLTPTRKVIKGQLRIPPPDA